MKRFLLRLWIFLCLWGDDDPWMDGEVIGASFAWGLAKPLAKFNAEMDGEYDFVSVR